MPTDLKSDSAKVAGSSLALTTKLELFIGRPSFNPAVMLVNNQLVCLPVSWDSNYFFSFDISGVSVN